MTLLREGEGINFQKASYTLDGCVKVYTSRIDSFEADTRKLLSGLTAQQEPQDQEGNNMDPEVSKQKKRRVNHI
jgi:condensin complex subunit 2